MLIFLDQSISGVPTVPINQHFDSPAAGETLTVIGRGTTSEGGSMANELREVNVPAVDHDTCDFQNHGSVNEDLMLCAGVPEGGKDSCQGGQYGSFLLILQSQSLTHESTYLTYFIDCFFHRFHNNT